MSASAPRRPLTLGVYPTVRGFGWIAFEGPLAAYDWGLVEVMGEKNARCLRKLERLIERLQPETLVLEAFEKEDSIRADRIARLCRGMISIAHGRGLDAAIYGRPEIELCFGPVGARTRQEIAEVVARNVEVLRSRLPNKRRPWQSDDRRMALFCAAAVVLTHFRYNAQLFLDDLKDAA